MKLNKDKSNVLFLTHYYFRAEGGEDTDERVVNYFRERAKKVVLITNPFPESDSKISYCFVYENGIKTKELRFGGFKLPTVLHFLNQVLIIYSMLFKIGISYDLCIAANNYSFIVIFPLRIGRIVKRLVYYSIDFVPTRYPNPFLDWLYHFIYKLACKYSDRNWVMAKEQIEGSRGLGISSANSAPFSIVPIGYDTKKINIVSAEKVNFYNIVYMGSLRESHGPQLAIEAMPLLIKMMPKVRLTIAGGGKYAKYLKSLAKKLKVKKYIDFTGYVEKFQTLTDLLVTKSIGLAPYKPIPGSFSYFADPSKIKLYMCCGLPVIATDVTTMASLINKTGSGRAVKYSQKSLADAILYLLGNRKRYGSFKEAAVKLSIKFDINHIMDNAMKKIPD